MALFTCAAKLDHGAHGERNVRTKAVRLSVGISHQRNVGYRPSRVNISWHKVSPLPSPVPFLMKEANLIARIIQSC